MWWELVAASAAPTIAVVVNFLLTRQTRREVQEIHVMVDGNLSQMTNRVFQLEEHLAAAPASEIPVKE